jgi:hypothetical protein
MNWPEFTTLVAAGLAVPAIIALSDRLWPPFSAWLRGSPWAIAASVSFATSLVTIALSVAIVGIAGQPSQAGPLKVCRYIGQHWAESIAIRLNTPPKVCLAWAKTVRPDDSPRMWQLLCVSDVTVETGDGLDFTKPPDLASNRPKDNFCHW